MSAFDDFLDAMYRTRDQGMPNRLTPQERYLRDAEFRALVDWAELLVRQAQFTPTELREAVVLGATHHEMRSLSSKSLGPFPADPDVKPGDPAFLDANGVLRKSVR